MSSDSVLLRMQNLEKRFAVRQGLFASTRDAAQESVRAVANVNLEIRQGESLGLVGQSGSGKTTLGMMLALLERPTSGRIEFGGSDIAGARGSALKALRRQIQIVFQDPYESLNPRYRIADTLIEPLRIHRLGRSREERRAIAREKLEMAGLRPAERYLEKYPHELSGGERQRVAIARAMVINPRFVIADEPVSMLDVSVRAGILNLMRKLRDDLQFTYLFITHDLGVARYMCDRIAIMYQGHIVEHGPTEAVLQEPGHEYTRHLIAAVPVPDPSLARSVRTPNVVASLPGDGELHMTQIGSEHFVLTGRQSSAV